MIPLATILLCLISSFGCLGAETRAWRNADGTSSFDGTYLSHDSREVTVRLADGKSFTVTIDELHPSDRAWLAALREDGTPEPEYNPRAIFDQLCFGDTRQQVEDKLKQSRMVETAVKDTFLGRFGLNGTFRTRSEIGGHHCELFFDWNESNRLKEITLQTEPQEAGAYSDSMRATWTELAELLMHLNGKPLQQGAYPKIDELENDLFLGSHLWRIQGGGSALLGTSKVAGKYLVVVRFTTDRIDPLVVP